MELEALEAGCRRADVVVRMYGPLASGQAHIQVERSQAYGTDSCRASHVLRALEVSKQVCLPRIDLSVRVLFTILAIVVGRALVGAYGSGFDLCLTGRL